MRTPHALALVGVTLLLVSLTGSDASSAGHTLRPVEPRDLKEIERDAGKTVDTLKRIETKLTGTTFKVALKDSTLGFERMVRVGGTLDDLDDRLERIEDHLEEAVEALARDDEPERLVRAFYGEILSGTEIEAPARIHIHSIVCTTGTVRLVAGEGKELGQYGASAGSRQIELGITVAAPLKVYGMGAVDDEAITASVIYSEVP